MATLKKKHLVELGFVRKAGKREYLYKTDSRVIRVQLTELKEEPIVSVLVGDEVVYFPGAHTLKDLRDLLFFIFDEDEYTTRFGKTD